MCAVFPLFFLSSSSRTTSFLITFHSGFITRYEYALKFNPYRGLFFVCEARWKSGLLWKV